MGNGASRSDIVFEKQSHIQRTIQMDEVINGKRPQSSLEKNKLEWYLCQNDISAKPELAALSQQFMKKGQSVEESTLLSDVTGSAYVPDLDDEISISEIKMAQTCIKEDKVSGDGWTKKK